MQQFSEMTTPEPGTPAAFQDFSYAAAAARRLRFLADQAERRNDPTLDSLLHEILEAAAQVEQEIALQRERVARLESLSVTDELTGLLNFRGLRQELERALTRARRRGERGLLVLCDLDHFKPINDTYGHQAGDAVLRAVGEILRSRVRATDYVARQGGDEFAVLMPDLDLTRGGAMVEALSALVNNLRISWHGLTIPVSASLGAAAYGPESDLFELVQRADEAAYARKKQARGRLAR